MAVQQIQVELDHCAISAEKNSVNLKNLKFTWSECIVEVILKKISLGFYVSGLVQTWFYLHPLHPQLLTLTCHQGSIL